MFSFVLRTGEMTLIDEEDYDLVCRYNWYLHHERGRAYVTCCHKSKILLMHRLLLDYDGGLLVDHIDRNTLNNQKSNLRICSARENILNRRGNLKSESQLKGVSKHGKGWRAKIEVHGKVYQLGTYPSKIQASWAYNHAAKKYFGEFAYLNEVN